MERVNFLPSKIVNCNVCIFQIPCFSPESHFSNEILGFIIWVSAVFWCQDFNVPNFPIQSLEFFVLTSSLWKIRDICMGVLKPLKTCFPLQFTALLSHNLIFCKHMVLRCHSKLEMSEIIFCVCFVVWCCRFPTLFSMWGWEKRILMEMNYYWQFLCIILCTSTL